MYYKKQNFDNGIVHHFSYKQVVKKGEKAENAKFTLQNMMICNKADIESTALASLINSQNYNEKHMQDDFNYYEVMGFQKILANLINQKYHTYE
jgi:hypothetical protein